MVEARLASTDKDEEGYYHLKYEVRYERGPGIATFKYHWRTHRFELFGFYVGPPR